MNLLFSCLTYTIISSQHTLVWHQQCVSLLRTPRAFLTRATELTIRSLIELIETAADKYTFPHLVTVNALDELDCPTMRHPVFTKKRAPTPLFPALQSLRWAAEYLELSDALQVLYVRVDHFSSQFSIRSLSSVLLSL